MNENYYEFLNTLQSICDSHPIVNSFLKNKYSLNAGHDVCYPVIAYTFNNSQRNIADNYSYRTISFNLLYADRLTHDRSNMDEIHSVGIDVLTEIENTLYSCFDYGITGSTLNLFKEQFADSVAGAVLTINMQMPVNMGECHYFNVKCDC